MHKYTATVVWNDTDNQFASGKYSRAHTWEFDGGIRIEASSSPAVVRLPYSKEEAVDPEEAFVASLSSCHMLTFLYLAWKEKFLVKNYRDQAEGVMAKTEDNRDWISEVTLKPQITFGGTAPSPEKLAELHHKAHEECYIANSVKTAVKVV